MGEKTPRVAVVYNSGQRLDAAEQASRLGQVYTFRGADRSAIHWLKGRYAGLSVNGCASSLRRLGIKPVIVDAELLDEASFDAAIYVDDTRSANVDRYATIGECIQGHANHDSADPVFGLDDLAQQISRTLGIEGKYPWGDYPNVLVLRHDTDSSDDATYLEYEIANPIPATYAVLPDRRCGYWLDKLKPYPFIETAWHWSSISGNRFTKSSPSQKLATRRGINRQMLQGLKRIPDLRTGHKHGNAFYYPETVDALDFAYRDDRELLGMSATSRWHMIKYGGEDEYTIQHPGVEASLWFPFHLWLATTEEWRPLRGWDMPMLIEPDFKMVDRVFDHARKFPGGVYMLGYHPAHARKDTFRISGCFLWFEYAVQRARDAGWWIASYRDVLMRLNEWENT